MFVRAQSQSTLPALGLDCVIALLSLLVGDVTTIQSLSIITFCQDRWKFRFILVSEFYFHKSLRTTFSLAVSLSKCLAVRGGQRVHVRMGVR